MHRHLTTLALSALCLLGTTCSHAQTLPPGDLEISASRFWGDVGSNHSRNFIVTFRRKGDRMYSIHFSNPKAVDIEEEFTSICMTLRIAMDRNYAGLVFEEADSAQLVGFLKAGERPASAGAVFERSEPIWFDDPKAEKAMEYCQQSNWHLPAD